MAEDPAVGVPTVDIDKFAMSFPLVLVGWPSRHMGMACKPFSPGMGYFAKIINRCIQFASLQMRMRGTPEAKINNLAFSAFLQEFFPV